MKKLNVLSLLAFMVLMSCSSEDNDKPAKDEKINLETTEFTLHFEDVAQIKATSSLDIEYMSESEYVAKVSSSGLITAGKVGETNIVLDNGKDVKKVEVIIEPKYNLFPEPIHTLQFNMSKEGIIEKLGSPSFQNATGMIYTNFYSFYSYMFLFDNNKVTSMAVVFDMARYPEALVEFLVERYQVVTVDPDELTAGFINEKQDLLIALAPTSDYSDMMILYSPRTNQSKSTDTDIKSAVEEMLLMRK